MWFVYLLRCSDDSLYTGIATDVARRVAEHNHSNTTGARYTRTRRPVRLVYQESMESRSAAAEREAQIKRLRKRDKESLITNGRVRQH